MFPTYLKLQTVEQKTKVMKSFSKIKLLVENSSNGLNFNTNDFAWAWFTVNTRAVYFKTSSTENPNAQLLDINSTGDHENLALAPFLDMFNHSSMASVEAGLNLRPAISNNCYEIITNTKYRKYDQVFINYGPHGNLRLYVDYGFAEENNQNDFVPVTIDEVKEIFLLHHDLTPESQIIDSALNIVIKHKLHENLRIEYTGPTWNIAAAFYVMSTTMEQKNIDGRRIKEMHNWHNVFMIEDFSGNAKISSQLLMLLSSKLKELSSSRDEISKTLVNQQKCNTASNSFRMAHRLISLHHYILESAVKYVAQYEN